MASFKDLLDKFDSVPLSPATKRVVMIGSAFAVVIVIVWYAVANEEKPKRRAINPVASTVLTDADTRGVGIDSMRSEIRELRVTLDELKGTVKDGGKSDNKDPSRAELEELKKEIRELKKHKDGQDSEKTNGANGQTHNAPKSGTGKGPYDVAAAEKALSANEKSLRPEDVYQRADLEPNDSVNGIQTSVGEADVKKEGATLKIRTIEEQLPKEVAIKDDQSDVLYLPATTMLTGTLITGMDAPTSKQARTDPFPALVRIQKEAILPNNFRADVRDCGMIVGGYGDLSSERAYLRGETISCVRNDGGVIEVSVDAYASGEDGKAGVRGNVVSKQKEYITRAMMAAFIQGASQLFSVQSIPTIRISRGDSESEDQAAFQQAFNPDAVQGAAVAGVGNALNRISEYYMDMAENLFPIIEIDAGRQIDFIIKKGASLKIKSVPKSKSS